MALIVLDSSSVGISKAPNDGFSIVLSEIEGFPEGLRLMIPFEGDHAAEVYDAISSTMSKETNVVVATPAEMAREAAYGPRSSK